MPVFLTTPLLELRVSQNRNTLGQLMKNILTFFVIAIGAISNGIMAQVPVSEDRVVVSNERGINSDELEFSPVFYKNGIVFISTRFESLIYNVKDKNIGGKNIMSIYRAERNEEGFLGAPEPLADELIFRLHEGPVTFDRTASSIFFTRNENQEKAPDGFKKLQIYTAEKSGEVWENIRKLSFNDVNYNYCHPSISPDEDVLFISSDIPGGYGGMDLYAVFKTDSTWSQMINLGDKVNTTGNEVFPYIAADGTLYFSSDGHGGLGNLDLFYSTKNQNTEEWRSPVNLGFPFNSSVDDFGFIVDRDNKNGYFSSDRPGGFGEDDIYSFYIENEESSPIAVTGSDLDGMVISDENGNPLAGALVSAINFKDVSLSASDEQVVRLSPGEGTDNFVLDVNGSGLGEQAETDETGKTDMPLRRGNYVVKVAKEGYLPQYVVITPDTDLDNLNISLQKAVNCVSLTGKVSWQGVGGPVSGATVKIVDVDSKEAITVYADARGLYEYCIDCNRTYSIYAEKDNVTSAPGIVSTKGVPCSDNNDKIDLPLYMNGSPIYAGMTIRLPNIYFNFDDDKLRPDAHRDLDEVAGLMNKYLGMKVELASHTDARGGKNYNQDLSYRRSQSVLKYLASQNVPEDRLQPIGYGETQIRNRCKDGVNCSESEHQFNRRTEIKIIELGENPENVVGPIAGTTSEGEKFAAETIAFREGENVEKDKGGQANSELSSAPEKTTELKDEFYKEGAYAVIAGTFANHNYALRRASLLMEKGFTETSIVRQERNGLYAVFVHTFDKKAEAFSLVKNLANKQVHAYVLKR